MNSYCVYNPKNNHILYIGSSSNCNKYIQNKNIKNYVVSHIYDIQFISTKPYTKIY